MDIVASPLDWTFIDEENFAKFLDTETGKRLIPKLAEESPRLLAAGDTNAILIRAGEVRGIQSIIQTLILLAHPAPKIIPATHNAYPPLDDDTAWPSDPKPKE